MSGSNGRTDCYGVAGPFVANVWYVRWRVQSLLLFGTTTTQISRSCEFIRHICVRYAVDMLTNGNWRYRASGTNWSPGWNCSLLKIVLEMQKTDIMISLQAEWYWLNANFKIIDLLFYKLRCCSTTAWMVVLEDVRQTLIDSYDIRKIAAIFVITRADLSSIISV